MNNNNYNYTNLEEKKHAATIIALEKQALKLVESVKEKAAEELSMSVIGTATPRPGMGPSFIGVGLTMIWQVKTLQYMHHNELSILNI